jgi:hypothetical protein
LVKKSLARPGSVASARVTMPSPILVVNQTRERQKSAPLGHIANAFACSGTIAVGKILSLV